MYLLQFLIIKCDVCGQIMKRINNRPSAVVGFYLGYLEPTWCFDMILRCQKIKTKNLSQTFGALTRTNYVCLRMKPFISGLPSEW